MEEKKEVANGTANGTAAVDSAEDGVHQGRDKWGNQLEFILTCVGYAVGLGNVWRFPYLCYKNGGGAFLIPYILMLVCCGLPVFFFELCFGQFASLGPLAIWKAVPMFKGIGIAMVTVCTFVSLYYTILVAYILYFFFASMGSVLPWADCGNSWNSPQCLTSEQLANKTFLEDYLKANNMTNDDIKTPSEEYFYGQVLKLSSGVDDIGGVVWQLALCLLLAWVVVFITLIRGISSLGKVVYFTSIFPYIMMAVMVVRGGLLPGAREGLIYYLKPDFNRLTDSEVWSDAAVQIFYSLSTCSGGLIAMASYNRFNNNCHRDSILVPLINCGTSIFSGLAIFSLLGYMAQLKGVDIAQVAVSGPGLVFVVYPEGLSQMPVSVLWAILFFFMMLTLGFSSLFSMVECIFTALMDEFPALRATPNRPVILRAVGCAVFYLVSLPMVCEGGFYWFSLVDSYAGGFPRLFIGLFELIALCWIYGLRRFEQDIKLMLGHRPNWYFKVTWCGLSPLIIVGIVVFKSIQHKPFSLFNEEYLYPAWGDVLGWLMVAAVVIWIPLWWVVQWCLDGRGSCSASITPADSWGPALKENRTGRYSPDAYNSLSPSKKYRNNGVIVTAAPQVYTTSYDNQGFSKY